MFLLQVQKYCVTVLFAILVLLQVQKYCTTVLSAMMSGMDDKDDSDDVITLEAMTGLSKIIAQVSPTDIHPILINVALRIRPCFESVRTSYIAWVIGPAWYLTLI